MFDKLNKLSLRYEEITHLLSSSSANISSDNYASLSKELANLEPIISAYKKIKQIDHDLSSNKEVLATENDAEMRSLIEDDIRSLRAEKSDCIKELQIMLLPRDPNDQNSAIVEIRAGAGGDEACLFVADLSRMYIKYAESQKFKVSILDRSEIGIGGFKEFIFQVKGEGAFRKFKHEAGTHRVQRVPATEAQGRIHTSTVTVAVLPEAEELTEIVINPNELKIDTYRSQGAGGQHVNTTDSSVRITHIPSGIVVSCQEERSQIKNRAKAMHYLKAKLYQQRIDKINQDEADLRKSMVGTGDRSERIRTYNYAQGRVSDHRIKLTVYRLEEIMQTGDISEIVEQLLVQEELIKLQKVGQDGFGLAATI